jgi:rhodanese-related sulfurtransferase
MAKQHSERFVKVVDEARKQIRECTVPDVQARLERGDSFHLIDVRELPSAVHIGKGVIERDIEAAIADSSAEIVLYCGGGYRSALAAASLQNMGYNNVISMDGGWREWKEAGYPVEHP